MKKSVYVLLLITQLSWATDSYQSFESANKYYQSGKYEQAIRLYQIATNNNTLESAELYFNLGNCYYKLHRVALAIYNFEKAAALNSSDIEIQTNLEFARKMAIDDIKTIPKVGFGKLLHDFAANYGSDTWAWIAVTHASLFLLLFIGYYYSGTSLQKRIFFMGMFIIFLGLFISLFAAYFEKNRLQNEQPAIVFAEITVVKAEPKKTGQDAFILHEGATVFIIDSVAKWKKIELADETTGWIEEDAIRKLQD